MAIMKVVEVMSDSDKSWEDATVKAVDHAGKTIRNIKSAWVQDQSVTVRKGKVDKYRVCVKITFEIDG
jgi:flavin-binding protein dodecin